MEILRLISILVVLTLSACGGSSSPDEVITEPGVFGETQFNQARFVE